ncbi:MAG: TIGR01212 family radical SAM protein [Planctomycetes bacterium]|nr:TIGR01212 family radical SAM protein [Planctomycetota bacterium]
MSDGPTAPRFRALQPWLAARFGRPVHRVALDAGSTCPNRDGTKGFGGCTYCDVEGSGTGALASGADLARQLEDGLARVARRGAGVGAIAYFQSYSNTYVEIARLREVLAVLDPWLARADRPIVAVSIATRPDTLPDAALDLLEQLARRVEVWVELGLETADDEVQRAIRRCHTLAEFEDAVARVRARGLVCVGHAILGLPGDGREGARRTAEALARTGVEGVKLHHLMVLRRTQLEKAWREGRVATLEADEYVDWLADCVERLAPEQVLHRLTGDAAPAKLVAPHWTIAKNVVRARLEAELTRRGTRQGSLHAARGAQPKA